MNDGGDSRDETMEVMNNWENKGAGLQSRNDPGLDDRRKENEQVERESGEGNDRSVLLDKD